MNRREVIKGLTAVAIGTPLLEVLDRWVLFGEDQRAGSRRVGLIGDQEIMHIEHAAVVFREWDDQFGGGLRRKAVVGQLNEVADLLRDSQPVELRRRLFAVMAKLSETSAIMSWDSGHQGLAQRYYVTAFRSARSAEDWAFGANILAGMARQMLYLGRPSDALELVRIAQSSSAGHATPGVVSMLHVREAWAYAKLGRVNAFHRAVGHAEDAFANVRADNEPDWMRYFDIAELEGTIGGRLLELARQDRRHAPLASERIARAVELRKSDRLRSSALDRLGLVEARLIEGNYEEAATLGESALEIVARTPSDRVQVMLTELDASVAKFTSIPAISSLRGHMRDVLRSKRDPNGAR